MKQGPTLRSRTQAHISVIRDIPESVTGEQAVPGPLTPLQVIPPAILSQNLALIKAPMSDKEIEYYKNPLFRGVGGTQSENQGLLEVELIDKLTFNDVFPPFQNDALAELAL